MKDQYSTDMPRFGEPKKKKEMSEETCASLAFLFAAFVFLLMFGGIIYMVHLSGQTYQPPWPAKYTVGQLVELDAPGNSPVFKVTRVWWGWNPESSRYVYKLSRTANGILFTPTYYEDQLRAHR